MDKPIDYTELDIMTRRALESYLGCTNKEPEKIVCSVMRTVNIRLDPRTVERLAQISLENDESIQDTIKKAIFLFLITV